MFKFIFQDWQINQGNRRSKFVLSCFRLAQLFNRLPFLLRWIGYPWFIFYELIIIWILGTELPYKITIGPRLRLFHGIGTVIHKDALLGSDITLRHSTTIGSKHENGGSPIIEDHVNIGCHSIILGNIRIGRGATIGAGSVVLNDVPEYAVVAGNPARIINS